MLEIYEKKVATVSTDASVCEAAERMRDAGVGCVVVMAEGNRPIGIVTDRDLTTRVIAAGRVAGKTPVSAVMSQPLHTVTPGMERKEVVELLRGEGIRRAPVVDGEKLCGIVTMDDLLVGLTDDLTELCDATRYEIASARRRARFHDIRRQVEERLSKGLEELEELGEDAVEHIKKDFAAIRDWLRDVRD